MPTLPGRATSILAVLGGFSPIGRRMLPHFDWPALVDEARPGTATEIQRQQAARFAHVQTHLACWVREQSLPADHLEECALYTTVATPPGMASAWAMAVARSIYWIYAVDDFIDKRDLHEVLAGKTSVARLDGELSVVLQPATSGARRILLRRYGLAWSRSRSTDLLPDGVALGEALCSVLTELKAQWAPLPGAWRQGQFRARTVAEHMVACVVMMRQELHWNMALTRRPSAPRLPSFPTYVRAGTRSIGMYAVAAAVAGFEAAPRRAWRDAQQAIDAAGRIVRLANDLHTYEADVEEGKVSAITIRLRDLGFPSAGSVPITNAEVRRAQAWVSEDLAHAIAAFSRYQVALRAGALSYYLRHIVAFALAVYGDGSRFRSGADSGQ